MAIKKYIVRAGFVVVLAIAKADGSTYDRTYDSGEEVPLDDEQAAKHQHKLEFATQKDRDAALAAEAAARQTTMAASSPVDLVQALVAALAQANATAAATATPAA